MKDNNDGFTVDNMNSQDLKEGDDQPKDDNSECFFNNSVASDQRSDISSSKNSEISECDSGVASLQETYCHIADKNKTSHSYFNSRTGTSFIHINSLNRHIIKNHNSYIEKEWELLKKKMMKPLVNKIPNESLEEQKKDISFIDEPDISNSNSNSNMKPIHHNFSLQNKTPELENSAVSQNKYTKINRQSNKSSLDKTDSICSLASSFYEPKDDYIGSSFSKTFLNFSTQSFLTKTSLSSSVFTKPLSSIKTSLSHSNTEIVSCIYNPVSSASPFNSSNPNPFNVQSYKDEFLSLDPNYVPRQLPTITTSSFQNSHNNILSSSTNKNYQDNKTTETIGFSEASNNESNCNSATKNSFTLKEYPATTIPTTISSNPVLLESGIEIGSKSARYQEMAQRKKMKNKKEKDQVITSDKVPDYIGNKDMDHILKYINNEKPDPKTFTETKDKGKKSKKKIGISVASTLSSKNCCKPCSQTDKNLQDEKHKLITVEKNEEKVLDIGDSKDFLLTNHCAKENPNTVIKTEVSSEDTEVFGKVIEMKTKIDSHEPSKVLTSSITNGVESINSLDHIDKFSNVPLTFKKESSKTKESVQTNFLLNECDLGFEGQVSKTSNFFVVTKRKKFKSKQQQQNTKTQESPNNDKTFVKNKLVTPLSKPSSANSARNPSRHMDNDTKIFTGIPGKSCNSFTRPVSSPQLQTSFLNLNQDTFNLTKSTFSSPSSEYNTMNATTTFTSTNSMVSSSTLTTTSNHRIDNSISFNADSEAKFKVSNVPAQLNKKQNSTNKPSSTTSQAFFLDTKNLDKTLNNDIDFMFGYDGDVKATNNKIDATKIKLASNDCNNIGLNNKLHNEKPQKKNINYIGNHNEPLFVNKSIVNMTSNHDTTCTTSIDQPNIPHDNATPANQECFIDAAESKQRIGPLDKSTPLPNISFPNHSTQPPIISPQLYLPVNIPGLEVSTSASLISTQNAAKISYPSTQNNHQHHSIDAHQAPKNSSHGPINLKASLGSVTYTSSFSTTKPHSKSLSPVSSSESPENPTQNQWNRPSNQQNQFNLHKAQIYLDTIFKEVLNSKDVKIYLSTG